jgi:hypothetical protein
MRMLLCVVWSPEDVFDMKEFRSNAPPACVRRDVRCQGSPLRAPTTTVGCSRVGRVYQRTRPQAGKRLVRQGRQTYSQVPDNFLKWCCASRVQAGV